MSQLSKQDTNTAQVEVSAVAKPIIILLRESISNNQRGIRSLKLIGQGVCKTLGISARKKT
jgi:hypothetical protein